MTDDITRRQLVRRAAALSALPVMGQALDGCARRIDLARGVDVEKPVDGLIQTPLANLTELQKDGGAVVLWPAGSTPGIYGRYPFPALVVAHAGGYLALNADCPHQGCELTWVAADKQAECPCHGSRFASDGTVLNPPAATPLTLLPIEVVEGNLQVQLLPGDGTFPPLTDGKITFNLSHFPTLATVPGVLEGRAAGYPYAVIVVRLTDDFHVLSAVCPHLGCRVEPSPDGFRCPCHGSQYTLSGKLVLGPSTSDLQKIDFSRTGDVMVISPAPF